MRSQKDLSTSGNLCLGPQPITGACNLAVALLLSLAERTQPQLLASVRGVTKGLLFPFLALSFPPPLFDHSCVAILYTT